MQHSFEAGFISPLYILMGDQVADILTKGLPREKHKKFSKGMRLVLPEWAQVGMLEGCTWHSPTDPEPLLKTPEYSWGLLEDSWGLLICSSILFTDSSELLSDSSGLLKDSSGLLTDSSKLLTDSSRLLTDSSRLLMNSSRLLNTS